MAQIAGLDGGSVSVKLVVLDDGGEVVHSRYRRHRGNAAKTALELLREARDAFPDLRLACTGSSGKGLARALGAPFVSELAALALAVSATWPEVRTVMEMGGEDSKLILLDEAGAMADFSLNSVCAAGTGSFLDQQAERMRLSIEEFAALAVQSRHPAHVAGRCSVFAKSDMIHLQQIATPLEDIVAGLCFAVARNFKGSIIRGRTIKSQIVFLGGVAQNGGVARAFREVFGQGGEDALLVPDPPTQYAALGAAMQAARADARCAPRAPDLDALARRLERSGPVRPTRPPLMAEGDGFAERHLGRDEGAVRRPDGPGREPVWLGIDVGSISTNLALVDRDGRLVAKRYLMTASRPIEAVRQGLREIAAEVGGVVDIRGVGTTGSGRYMIAAFVRADIVKNEITAQAAGAVALDPTVDTIFEIGGQDSKFISLERGVIADFEMNKACAAGTGSFLEEQADKLDVAVKDEFARLALGADAPCRLGERCTVFMENSLMAELASGAGRDDLLAGLAYSIVENYLNRVVGARKVGQNIFFQGGTAFNTSVVAAFEKHLGQTVTVPEHHDVTGAIGMALIARDHALSTDEPTRFRGLDLADARYELDSFTCKECDNRCEINRVRLEGEKTPLLFGGRCERYDMDRSKARQQDEDLFAWRDKALRAEHERRARRFARESAQSGRPARLGRIGLPFVFFMHDQLPWFSTLCWELGFEPVVSPPTDRTTIRLGVETVLAETCFPVKAALGHVRRLLDQDVDRLLLPSFIDASPADYPFEAGLACPLTQSFPYQARTAFPDAVIAAPPLDRRDGRAAMTASLLRALAPFGVRKAAMRRAMRAADAAQAAFEAAVAAKGREALDNLDGRRALAVLGRPYNAFDKALNLGIPSKLASLGVRAIPMDMLPDDGAMAALRRDWPDLYWRSGQRILAALRTVKADQRLHPLILGSFSCGPDSFIAKYVERELDGAPCLSLEIDEHSADAGAVTRLEAFLDSIEAQERAGRHQAWTAPPPPGPQRPPVRFQGRSGRTVWVPRMADHAFALEAAFRYCGADAEVLPETDVEAVAAARRYISGKECYPFAVTTADVLKKASEPDFDPSRAAFFMAGGSGPCRFGQYNVAQRMVLDRAGFPDLAIHSPMQDVELYEDLGIVGRDFTRRSWLGIVAIDLLTKSLHATRPMARQPAQADAAYDESLARVRQALLCNGSGDGDELRRALARARRDFADIERHSEPRPLIGIVGEIFVRSNRFSNEDLVRKVEALGGRAWLAPIDEWVYYVNAMAKRTTRIRKQWKRHLALRLKDHFQRRMAEGLESVFNGCLDTIHDPDTETILAKADPWVHASFRGEAVLSVGKAVDMIERGAAGIVAAMPFGCMPGTVATAIMRGLSARHRVPCISLPFDGTDSPSNRLQLEAFMEQAAALAARREGPAAP